MSVKNIVQDMLGSKPKQKIERSKHTIYVDDRQYRIFMEVCKVNNSTPSEIIDKLIFSFLEETEKLTGEDILPKAE